MGAFLERISGWISRLPQRNDQLSSDGHKRELALFKAVNGNDLAMAEQYIKAGANINYSEPFLGTPLLWAVEIGSEDMVRLLLSRKAKPDISMDENPPLIRAAEVGNEAIFSMLMKARANIHARDHDGNTPLMRASKAKGQRMVALLLKAGAKVNDINRYERTPLMMAAESRAVASQHGMELHGNNGLIIKMQGKKWGEEADIQYADGISTARSETIKHLLEAGAEINARDNWGQTALMKAAAENNIEALELLVKAGGNIEIPDVYGLTALMKTARDGRIEAAQILLKAGANKAIKTEKGESALSIAESKGNTAIAGLLKTAQ